MHQSYIVEIIRDFCSYFGKTTDTPGNLNCKIPEIQIKGNSECLKGIRNIVSSVDASQRTPECEALHDQWMEYALTHASYIQNASNAAHILKELNEYLVNKVHFVGNKHSPADILMFLFIYDVMVDLTFQDREKYINVSRWFSYIQNDQKLMKYRTPLCFSRTRLYA